MTQSIVYRGDNTGAFLSGGVWADCPWEEILQRKIGYGYFLDFLSIEDDGTITSVATRIYDGVNCQVWGDAAGTVLPVADELGGVIALFSTNDNQQVSIQVGSAGIASFGPPFQITQNAGKMWFECRLKTNTITTSEQGFFVGLAADITQSAILPLTATAAIGDINCVGFHKPEANTTAFDTSYKADGVTAVEVNSDVGTLVADTYVKLGMRFDGASTLRFYIDGVEQASTKTIPDATGTDFPADVQMTPIISCIAGTNNDQQLEVDWISCYQLR